MGAAHYYQCGGDSDSGHVWAGLPRINLSFEHRLFTASVTPARRARASSRHVLFGYPAFSRNRASMVGEPGGAERLPQRMAGGGSFELRSVGTVRETAWSPRGGSRAQSFYG